MTSRSLGLPRRHAARMGPALLAVRPNKLGALFDGPLQIEHEPFTFATSVLAFGVGEIVDAAGARHVRALTSTACA